MSPEPRKNLKHELNSMERVRIETSVKKEVGRAPWDRIHCARGVVQTRRHMVMAGKSKGLHGDTPQWRGEENIAVSAESSVVLHETAINWPGATLALCQLRLELRTAAGSI